MPERPTPSISDFPEPIESPPDDWETLISRAQQILVQASEAAGNTSPHAWAETLRRRWEAVEPFYTRSPPAVLDKFIPQAIAYLVFSEQALKIIEIFHDDHRNGDWRAALQDGFDNIRDTFFQPFEARDTSHPGLAAFWGLPLDIWQQLTSSLASPEDSQSTQLWLDYRQAHRKYTALLRQAAMRSLDLLQDRLVQMGGAGRTVGTLREFYNLWVDCSEEAYAEIVRSEEYSRINARMINSLMRFRQYSQHSVDETLNTPRQ